MIACFYLLGAFEVGVNDERRAIGDTMAAKILAYLAYRNCFCDHNDIALACWGKARGSGSGKLEDEAYRRQVSNLRSLLGDLGLPVQDYLLDQPNGLQLREGTFTTDVMRFDELSRMGRDQSLATNERITALQEAERLRRGYVLDGMHCEWITSQDRGARPEYAAKFRAARDEMDALRRTSDRENSTNRVPFCDGFYQALPLLRDAIGKAAQEIIFYGMDFRVTIPVIADLLQDRLRAGVRVKFLMLDPGGRWAADLAPMIDDNETTLREECRISLRRLEALAKQMGASAPPALLEIATFDGLIPGRFYAVDPAAPTGQVFFFPYMNGTAPTRLPGYLWSQRHEHTYAFYAAELSRTWQNANNSKHLTVSAS